MFPSEGSDRHNNLPRSESSRYTENKQHGRNMAANINIYLTNVHQIFLKEWKKKTAVLSISEFSVQPSKHQNSCEDAFSNTSNDQRKDIFLCPRVSHGFVKAAGVTSKSTGKHRFSKWSINVVKVCLLTLSRQICNS